MIYDRRRKYDCRRKILICTYAVLTTLKMYSNGRVTIPDYIRNVPGLKDGDLVKVIIERANEEK